MKYFLILLTSLTLGYQSIVTADVAENIVTRDLLKARAERTEKKADVKAIVQETYKNKKSKYVYPQKVWQKKIEGNLVLFADYSAFFLTVDFEGPYYGNLMMFTIDDDGQVQYSGTVEDYYVDDYDGTESIVHDLDELIIFSSVFPPSQVIRMD
jgi:hypothetical protein